MILSIQQSLSAQCHIGSVTITSSTLITGSCVINGDLTIVNGGTLNVDLTGIGADTFVVQGNILLQGNAVLWIHAAPGASGDQFIVSNTYNEQRTITTKDSSRLKLENIEFRTQEGNLANAVSMYMNYNAKDNSILYVNKTWLDPLKAWLLCNMFNKSTLIGFEPKSVPTETYLQDTAQIVLHGANTSMGLWLNFQDINDTLNLPPNQALPYTWKVGRGFGGLASPWYLEVDTANPGLGVQIFPSSKITVNGSGLPATGELKTAVMFANGTDTLKNLKTGLQNTTVADGPNGRITLNNVNLGPIAWQIYILMNEDLFIKKSVINEIGIAGPSHVTVDSCLLQLAVIGAVGAGGCTMTINNTEIWNQSINAANNSTMILNNCKVTGSVFSTADAQSHITVNGGCFFSNPAGCTPSTMVNIATGQPNCNPFIPSGFPQNLTPATVTFNSVNNNCVTGINETANANNFKVFPNPSQDIIQVNIPNPNQNFSIEVYSAFGQLLLKTNDKTIIDISNFTHGIYIITVKQDDKIWTRKIVKK